MDTNIIETLLDRILNLEKKVEKYYELLKIENELDFILNGTYFFAEELADVIEGNY